MDSVSPKDIQATAMSEWELCELFNVTAPTIRAGIKTLCKNGILNECEIRHTIRLSDKCSMEVYSLETIIALFSEKKMLVFSFRKYSLSRTALRTCFALYVPIRNARAIIVSRL